jgi:outer membrane protein assembly factor BamB
VLWSKDFKKDYGAKADVWGWSSHPLIEGQKLICVVGGEGSLVVAFDKDDGKELWKSLSSKEQGYSPPTVIEAGGKRQLLIWDPRNLNSLDPETGKPYWAEPLKPAYGMSIMAPRKDADLLFAGGIGDVAACFKLAKDRPAAEVLWRGTPRTAVYPVCMTPFVEDGIIYGVDTRGELRGVKMETGERLWETYKPTTGERFAQSGTAFLVKNGDRFILFNETGDLIIAKLSPKGYEEVSRAHILEPTGDGFGRPVVWSHPAFANKCVFARNDKEIVCVSLAAE